MTDALTMTEIRMQNLVLCLTFAIALNQRFSFVALSLHGFKTLAIAFLQALPFCAEGNSLCFGSIIPDFAYLLRKRLN